MFALLELAHFALYFMFCIRGQMFGWSLLSVIQYVPIYIFFKKSQKTTEKRSLE